MNYKSTLKTIKKIEFDYKILDEKLKNHNILKSNTNFYKNEDKQDFLKLWKKYIQIFKLLQHLIKKSNYRRFLFRIDYNKFAIRRYLLIFYFNCLVWLLNNFWEHEEYIRTLLLENFKYDYWEVAKFIYRPHFANLLNTPYIFLKFRKHKIKDSLLFMLDLEKNDVWNVRKILTDYKNFYYYTKYRILKIIFLISYFFWNTIAKTRFSNRSKWLVKKKNFQVYLDIAEPWDILLSRLNWWASNMTIPWFWKHMCVYIWKWDFLKKNFWKKFKFLNSLDNSAGYIIESTWRWVHISNIDLFRKEIDYFWAVRTNFTLEKKYRAIKNSLKYYWYSYDYLFNFYSNTSVVCSELVVKSYAKEKLNDEWFDDLNIKKSGLILTYPPNNFIFEIFSNNNNNLEPLIFIDSLEKDLSNFISTNEEFEKSAKRSRFSLMLK